MQSLLTIKTHLEKGDYKKILIEKGKGQILKSAILIVFLSILATAMGSATTGGFKISRLIVYLLVLTAFTYLSTVIRINKLSKSIEKNQSAPIFLETIIEFYDNEVILKNEGYEEENKISYNLIKGLSNFNEFYLLNLNNTQASIIRKKDLKNGQEEELKNILKEKLSIK